MLTLFSPSVVRLGEKGEREEEGTNHISLTDRSWRRGRRLAREGTEGKRAAQVVCHGFSMRGWTCSSLLLPLLAGGQCE